MIADRHTHTDRQTDTLITILGAPLAGRSNDQSTDLQTALTLRLPKAVQDGSSSGQVLYQHSHEQRAIV